MAPLGVLSLRVGFLLARIRLIVAMYVGALPALRFIHFASWSLVTVLPATRSHLRERLKSPYLLFLTNFNGDFDQYIDAFAYVLWWRVTLIWRFSYGFPGTRPSGPFKDYIVRQELPSLYYYSAYPGETAATIEAGLRVDRALTRFLRNVEGDAPEAFARRYTRLLTQLQREL
jgi:hypothetical protein